MLTHATYSRQMRKLDGGLAALAAWVDEAKGAEFLVRNKLSIADLAIAGLLGWLSLRFPAHGWQTQYPKLKTYWEGLEERKSFAETRPTPQTPKDKVV